MFQNSIPNTLTKILHDNYEYKFEKKKLKFVYLIVTHITCLLLIYSFLFIKFKSNHDFININILLVRMFIRANSLQICSHQIATLFHFRLILIT